MRTVTDRTWALGTMAFAVWFLGTELHAYFFRGRTFTRASQGWLGLQPRKPRGRYAALLLTAAWAWLTAHLLELRVRQILRYKRST